MTYFRFHLVFNLPVLVLCSICGAEAWLTREVWGAALLVMVPVMLFTTPWDNYAAKHGIWGFSQGQYWKRIGHLPFEEYLFFVIQSFQAMALTLLFLRGGEFATWEMGSVPGSSLRWISGGAVALVWLVVGCVLAGRMRKVSQGKWHYSWHLLYWFIPLILLQWWMVPEILAPRWGVILVVTLVLGGYLSWADWMAIKRNIWFFDHQQTTGMRIGKVMPWEEAAFFFLTSMLVAQSFLLLLPENLRS